MFGRFELLGRIEELRDEERRLNNVVQNLRERSDNTRKAYMNDVVSWYNDEKHKRVDELLKLDADLHVRRRDAAAELAKIEAKTEALKHEAKVIESANAEKKAVYDEAVRVISEASKKLVESANARANDMEGMAKLLVAKMPNVDLSRFNVSVEGKDVTVVK